jgi:hypothetical protein
LLPAGSITSFDRALVADRLAAERWTETTIYELADDRRSGGDHVAVNVLRHWD